MARKKRMVNLSTPAAYRRFANEIDTLKLPLSFRIDDREEWWSIRKLFVDLYDKISARFERITEVDGSGDAELKALEPFHSNPDAVDSLSHIITGDGEDSKRQGYAVDAIKAVWVIALTCDGTHRTVADYERLVELARLVESRKNKIVTSLHAVADHLDDAQ